MDIGKIIQLSEGVVKVVHPTTKEVTDLEIIVHAPHTDVYKKAVKALLKDEDSDAFLVSCTKGWKNLQRDGKSVKFSKKACEQLYKDAPWLKQQVDIFLAKAENFLQAS